jgi:3'(2'), 5'-bisphosphate nucleotidase
LNREDLVRIGAIAREAGQAIMQIYASDFQVDYKGPGDPVTDADRAANSLICARLHAAFPDAAIVAEESALEAYEGYQRRSRVFFVDPLDGTREFVAKNGQFVVMIGLVVETEAALGVVYAPARDTLWCGARGLGAYRVDATGERQIHVGAVGDSSAARITVSRSRRSDALKRALDGIAPREVTPMGSAGLKGSLVAEDSVDAYLAIGQAGKHWDACAMDALVTAAGGRVTDARGERLDYRSARLEIEHGLLASNPTLHRALLTKIEQLGPDSAV